MSFDQLMKDYAETSRIKEWRTENKIEINEKFLALVNKREAVRTQIYTYAIMIAFGAGLLIGVYL